MAFTDRLHNRGSISTGYNIDYSLKNESANGERFQTGNLFTNYSSTQTYTFSMWVKRTEISNRGYILNFQANTGISVYLNFAADSSTQALYYLFQNSSVQAYGKTTALFRDTSAWYHIVFRVDTTQATAADRVRIYVNGVQQDLESGGGGHPAYPSQNYNVPLQQQQYLLGYDGGNNGFSGYCADYYFIDGQSLAPTEFGEFDSATGIWKPIEYQGTFGNEGYYLDFADASALGKDVSPNNQGNFTHYGGSSADQATDTPTNNFATFNILNPTYGSCVINEGATQIEGDSTGSFRNVQSTLAVTSGKWYCELVPQLASTMNTSFGVVNLDTAVFDTTWYNNAGYWGGNFDSGASIYFYTNGGGAGSEPVSFSGTVGLAFDADNGTLDFYLNNSHQEQLTGIPSGTFAFFADVQGTGNPYIRYNFGGYTVNSISSAASDANGYGTFEYAPPSGYYALCSKNLAEFG